MTDEARKRVDSAFAYLENAIMGLPHNFSPMPVVSRDAVIRKITIARAMGIDLIYDLVDAPVTDTERCDVPAEPGDSA